MKQIDLIALVFGLIWGVITYLLMRTNKSEPQMWPRILGLGVAIYMFLSLMTANILSRPLSQFLSYTPTSLLLSFVAGMVSYFAGLIFAGRFGKKRNGSN